MTIAHRRRQHGTQGFRDARLLFPTPRSRAHPPRPRRHGRALAECVVAIALLGIAVSASSTLARAALTLTDDARILGRGLAGAMAQAERTTLEACGSGATTGSTVLPRHVLAWADVVTASTRQRRVDITLHFSPLTQRPQAALAVNAGGICPW
jgi:hypothetical protein